MYGGDLDRPIKANVALEFSLFATLIETLVFTPVVAIRSVSTLRQLNLARDELDRLAHSDPLTGLLNRRGFDELANSVATSPGALRRRWRRCFATSIVSKRSIMNSATNSAMRRCGMRRTCCGRRRGGRTSCWAHKAATNSWRCCRASRAPTPSILPKGFVTPSPQGQSNATA
jgi:hypothetical protein